MYPFTKKSISKLASTGKISPEKVRVFLNKYKKLYEDKVGKLDFNLDKVLKNHDDFPKDSYYTDKNFITTVGTVGASVLSCNIVTPLIRNAMASRVQKTYIENKNNMQSPVNYSSNMKI